jgi:hypothetical protein
MKERSRFGEVQQRQFLNCALRQKVAGPSRSNGISGFSRAPLKSRGRHNEGGSPQRGKRGQELECWPAALPLQAAVSMLVR